MDWYSSRTTVLKYMAVDPVTFDDIYELDMILDGGKQDRNALSTLKVSGSLPFISDTELGNNLLRVYSVNEQNGEKVTVAHATLQLSQFETKLQGLIHKGNASLYSLLLRLEEMGFAEPYPVIAGASPVEEAVKLVQSAGLRVLTESSESIMERDNIFKAGSTYLEAVNWLLEYAGFLSADVDGYGNVRFKRYVDPAALSPVLILSDKTPNCTFKPGAIYEFDTANVPNQIIGIVSDPDIEMSAIAINDDPANQYSTVSKGRIISRTIEFSDIEDQDALQRKTDQALESATTAVESDTVEHVFEPFEMNDGALFEYTESGHVLSGVVASSSMVYRPSLICATRIRRFVRS